MAFAPNPPITPGGGAAAYPSLVGRTFGNSSGIVLNLGSTPLVWSVAPPFARYEQLSAPDATVAVNNEARVVSTAGPIGSGALTLPAYSITRLH